MAHSTHYTEEKVRNSRRVGAVHREGGDRLHRLSLRHWPGGEEDRQGPKEEGPPGGKATVEDEWQIPEGKGQRSWHCYRERLRK
jgi:hypothetical protein